MLFGSIWRIIKPENSYFYVNNLVGYLFFNLVKLRLINYFV